MEYVICIAFPLQQWVHEPALMLHYSYIACLVMLWFCPTCWYQDMFVIFW